MARRAKRLIDIAVAVAALIVASPVLLVVALAIRLTMGSPVLYRQQRAGYRGQPFTILKFRTLRNETVAADGRRLQSGERVTPLGAFLRSRSLDELPQLWNVLRGDMSLVGPRPMYVSYTEAYTPEQARRLEARPGITGWAQVNGRQDIDFPTRFALDAWYVDHWSLWLDARILLATARKVAAGAGIAAGGGAAESRWQDADPRAPGDDRP